MDFPPFLKNILDAISGQPVLPNEGMLARGRSRDAEERTEFSEYKADILRYLSVL